MLDMNELIKQAKSMQEKMDKIHKQRTDMEFVGKSGADLVSVTVNGEKQILKIDISKDIINPDDKEILEDLIVAAINDAFQKSDKSAKEEMGNIFSGFNMPGGKLPF